MGKKYVKIQHLPELLKVIHKTVNHSKEFKTAEGIHNNYAESVHSVVKRIARKYNYNFGHSAERIQRMVALGTLFFKKTTPNDRFKALLKCVREYPFPTPDQLPVPGNELLPLNSEPPFRLLANADGVIGNRARPLPWSFKWQEMKDQYSFWKEQGGETRDLRAVVIDKLSEFARDKDAEYITLPCLNLMNRRHAHRWASNPDYNGQFQSSTYLARSPTSFYPFVLITRTSRLKQYGLESLPNINTEEIVNMICDEDDLAKLEEEMRQDGAVKFTGVVDDEENKLDEDAASSAPTNKKSTNENNNNNNEDAAQSSSSSRQSTRAKKAARGRKSSTTTTTSQRNKNNNEPSIFDLMCDNEGEQSSPDPALPPNPQWSTSAAYPLEAPVEYFGNEDLVVQLNNCSEYELMNEADVRQVWSLASTNKESVHSILVTLMVNLIRGHFKELMLRRITGGEDAAEQVQGRFCVLCPKWLRSELNSDKQLDPLYSATLPRLFSQKAADTPDTPPVLTGVQYEELGRGVVDNKARVLSGSAHFLCFRWDYNVESPSKFIIYESLGRNRSTDRFSHIEPQDLRQRVIRAVYPNMADIADLVTRIFELKHPIELVVSREGSGYINFPMQSENSCFLASTNRLINLLSFENDPHRPYPGFTTRARCLHFQDTVIQETIDEVTDPENTSEWYEVATEVFCKYLQKVMFGGQ